MARRKSLVEAQEIELTVLMPCLNESETLATCIKKAQSFIARSSIVGEIVVADNGSTDGSQEIARGLGARLVTCPQKGYGAALLSGIQAARGRYIIMGDSDDSYDFANLRSFVAKLRDGVELVIGNRFQGGIEPGAMPALHRYLGNPVLSLVGRLFFRIPVGDFHCGLRGFRADSIRRLDLQAMGMEFASEMIVRAALAGLRIEEVATTLKPDGRTGKPHLRTWRDGWRHLKFLLLFSPRWLFIIPGTLLVGIGLILSAALFLGPVQIGNNVSLDLNTLIAACFLILTGVQLLTFGALSRHYAAITGILPMSPRATSLIHYLSLDRLVLVSLPLLVAGASLFAYAIGQWSAKDFGPLSDPSIPRMVVIGMTLVTVGVQIFFSGFLFGVLNIPFQKRDSYIPPQKKQDSV